MISSAQAWQIQDNKQNFGTAYWRCSWPVAATRRVYRLAVVALGAAAAAAALAAAAGWVGLIQQAWTRPFRLSAAFGSMLLACKIRQRKAAWTWAPGQPKRS